MLRLLQGRDETIGSERGVYIVEIPGITLATRQGHGDKGVLRDIGIGFRGRDIGRTLEGARINLKTFSFYLIRDAYNM